jgi:hypothetical protein
MKFSLESVPELSWFTMRSRPPRQRLRRVLGNAQQLGGESPLSDLMEVKG